MSWEGILDEDFLRTAVSVCVEFSSSDFRPAEWRGTWSLWCYLYQVSFNLNWVRPCCWILLVFLPNKRPWRIHVAPVGGSPKRMPVWPILGTPGGGHPVALQRQAFLLASSQVKKSLPQWNIVPTAKTPSSQEPETVILEPLGENWEAHCWPWRQREADIPSFNATLFQSSLNKS